jgi:phosphoribosylaminoimidazolecarboxamide formyltransferase/IMP cyclohydrolase
MLPIQRALISVFDKSGLVEFARQLTDMGVEILSTGGTHRALEEAGIPVISVSEITGHPEILGGRVKTLHPNIHGGILANRSRAGHLTELQEHGIRPIDLVVVNLYPFQETAASDAPFEEIIEMIDIGGPSMIRGGAKNFNSVTVVVDPGDYTQVLTALENGELVVPEPLRRGLAIKAFRHSQAYDAAIATWLEAQSGEDELRFPRYPLLNLAREMEPRYGENPHQVAAVYRFLGGPGVLGGMEQLQGKRLSFNNFLDADAARRLVAAFEEPTTVIVKHNNPCGVGRGDDLETAYHRALACDPLSAFGSVIALNRCADRAVAEAMTDLFIEVIIAPGFDEEAKRHFAAKKNLRLICCPPYLPTGGEVEYRAIDGGFLAQGPDSDDVDASTWTSVTERKPSAEEMRALEMAWKTARGVKSNAIVVARGDQTIGVGAGQMSRVDACQLAISKAQIETAGAAAASDAFFPFRDGLDVLSKAGVKAVVQPGGSKRDKEVIAAAEEFGVAMMFTGKRHFRH